MKYENLTLTDIDRIDHMSAEEIRDLINTDFELFKAYWECTGPSNDQNDLHFYTTPEGYDVVVTGPIEGIEDYEY